MCAKRTDLRWSVYILHGPVGFCSKVCAGLSRSGPNRRSKQKWRCESYSAFSSGHVASSGGEFTCNAYGVRTSVYARHKCGTAAQRMQCITTGQQMLMLLPTVWHGKSSSNPVRNRSKINPIQFLHLSRHFGPESRFWPTSLDSGPDCSKLRFCSSSTQTFVLFNRNHFRCPNYQSMTSAPRKRQPVAGSTNSAQNCKFHPNGHKSRDGKISLRRTNKRSPNFEVRWKIFIDEFLSTNRIRRYGSGLQGY